MGATTRPTSMTLRSWEWMLLQLSKECCGVDPAKMSSSIVGSVQFTTSELATRNIAHVGAPLPVSTVKWLLVSHVLRQTARRFSQAVTSCVYCAAVKLCPCRSCMYSVCLSCMAAEFCTHTDTVTETTAVNTTATSLPASTPSWVTGSTANNPDQEKTPPSFEYQGLAGWLT